MSLRSIALAVLLLPGFAFAQLGTGGAEPFSISLSTQYPQPGSTAALVPQTSGINLANSTLSVSVNGTRVYSGAAQATPITLAPVGHLTTISATLSSNGTKYTKTLSLRPGSVSLVAEPLSTAPRLYPGKPLVPYSGSVRLVAVADFRSAPTSRIDPATLVYTWSVDGATMRDASGIGRSSIVVSSPLPYRSKEVQVLIQSQGGSLSGGRSVSLSAQAPLVRIYRNDPLQGIVFDTALHGTQTILNTESTFTASAFSFPKARVPNISWFLDGNAVQSGPFITVRPEGAGQGSATLSVTASSGAESAAATLPLSFGRSSSLFGI